MYQNEIDIHQVGYVNWGTSFGREPCPQIMLQEYVPRGYNGVWSLGLAHG
jgi:hypothetical protein